jgi:hypothetical protein
MDHIFLEELDKSARNGSLEEVEALSFACLHAPLSAAVRARLNTMLADLPGSQHRLGQADLGVVVRDDDAVDDPRDRPARALLIR